MAALPTEYIADVLRIDLAHLGVSRIILVGDADAMESGGLRTHLARWGIQVLIPPQEVRPWIASLAQTPFAQKPPVNDADASKQNDELTHLKSLLAHGVEHGVGAIVTTGEQHATWVRACNLDVPVLTLAPHGSIVPVRSVIFDMGGVLFRWDPLSMARRVCGDDEDARLLASAVFDSPEWTWQDAGAVDDVTVAWTSKTRLPRRLHASVDELVYHWHDHRTPVGGMERLIRDLKHAGFGIYLLSNAGESFAHYREQLPAYECYDGMVVSCYEHMVKPDERIYRILIDRYDLDAAQCLFVDDTKNNVHAARRIGMRGWHFNGDAANLRALLLED